MTPVAPVASAAETLWQLASSRPATLGTGRLICLDGPAGSGKTTLAAALAGFAAADGTDVRVVHLDDLYVGWAGLPQVDEQLAELLAPLAAGVPGRYRRYDWVDGRQAEAVVVAPVELLIVDGVGSGSPRVADLVTTLAWIAVPDDLRLARGLARDGEGVLEEWRRWMVEEREIHARDATAARADILIDGTGARAPRLRS